MGITKCNTMDAIWMTRLRCPDHFGVGEVPTITFNLNVIFHLLFTNDN